MLVKFIYEASDMPPTGTNSSVHSVDKHDVYAYSSNTYELVKVKHSNSEIFIYEDPNSGPVLITTK